MAQEDYVIADQTGVSFLGDLNNTLAAIVSNNSGATQPTVMYAFMWWYDTNVGVLKLRNAANNAWTTPFADKYDKIGGVLTGQASSTAGDFNLVTNTALSDAAASLTAAQLIGGEFTITPSVARIQTLDTAANIISALSGSVDGSNFTFTIVNLAAFDVTIATAAGVTLVGNMVVNDGSATFRVRRLNSSTVSVTRIETGSSAATSQIMIVRDEKSNGTSGGTFTSGAWRTRDLNDVTKNTIAGASLASDRITLPAGTYRIIASAPGAQVSNHKIKLANITDTSDQLMGTSSRSAPADNTQTRSFIDDIFTIAAQKVFEIQHRSASTQSSTGLGVSSSFSVVEIYTMITIEKIG